VHAIPGFSLITKYGTKLLGKAGQTFIDWWNDRGGRTLYDIDELSQNALLRRLPSYFGADLMDALARKRPPWIVIMLDTYEALWRGRGLRDGPGALRIDDWVRLLVQDSPGVMFIIFGRDKLRWHEIDPQARWNDVISEYLLGGLNRRDADALLIKWRVQESTIRIRMIAGSSSGESHTVDEQTEAYLPFYLELQALTYRNITAQGRVPRPEDFGSDQPQILARFLEHLDGESDKLVRVASYLSALDSEVLDMLSDKFLGGRASTDWSRLYGRSLISEEREGFRFVHNLLRKALQKREQDDRPELYRDIHQALFDWFDIRSGSSELSTVAQEQEPALLAAIRHLSQFDQKKAVHWASTQMPRLDEAGRWRILEEVCQLVLPLAETNYGAEHRLTTNIWSWLAAAALSNGHYVEAEALYKRVQATQERTLGPNHPSTARTLASLANLYGDTGRYVEAEALYEHVRVIQERALGAEHPSTVTTLANLAKVYRDTGRYGEAEALYEFVQAIQERTFGPVHPWTATMLANIANVCSDTGRYADAEALHKRARAIYEKSFGPEHPWTVTMLANIACTYRDAGRYAESANLFGLAQQRFATSLPPRDLAILRLLVDRGKLHALCGENEEATNDFFEALDAFEALGVRPEYRWAREAREGLAKLDEANAQHRRERPLSDWTRRSRVHRPCCISDS
jgi:tetratricopeptide (TPR) repeat protein